VTSITCLAQYAFIIADLLSPSSNLQYHRFAMKPRGLTIYTELLKWFEQSQRVALGLKVNQPIFIYRVYIVRTYLGTDAVASRRFL
jgi:hypothetical protein